MWSAISRSLPQFAPARRHQSRRRLTLERLEGRSLLSTIPLTVTTLLDDPITLIPGQTTLRDAINTADGGATNNKYVITFSVSLPGTIDLKSALPDLNNNIVIKGPRASKLTVQRDLAAVPFSVLTVDSGENVKISDVTIEGGNSGSYGGGIANFGTLTVKDSDLIDNHSGYDGGGIYSDGTVTVMDSIFVNNSANNGGGIFSEEPLTVIGSVFSGNSAYYAGGIYSSGQLKVTASIFTDNSAIGDGYGGGIFNISIVPMIVTNSIFTDNSATNGGGIFNYGTLTVSGSIFHTTMPLPAAASTTIVAVRRR